MEKLFGGAQGPRAGELAAQNDRQRAVAADLAKSEGRAAAAAKRSSLRKSLAYRAEKKGSTGG